MKTIDREDMSARYPQNLYAAVFGFGTYAEPETGEEVCMMLGDRGALEVAMLMANLSDREADILRYRYRQNKTYEDLMPMFDLSRERIRQIEIKALRKMRKEQCRNLLTMGLTGWLDNLIQEEAKRVGGQMVDKLLRERLDEAEELMQEREAEKMRIALGDTAIEKIGGKEYLNSIKIEELELTVRSYNCLKRGGINTVGDITEKTYGELMKVRNLGRKSLNEIVQKIGEMGLTLKEEEAE